MKTLTIIVNYKSADLTFSAVRSVLDSESLGSMEVAVVDNSQDEEEAERLRRGLPSTVRLRVSPENIGFGRACNMAYEGFQGDAILLLNPDAKLLPGCLTRLQKTLFLSDRVGAVSSLLYWDEEQKFYLPSSYPLGPLIFQDFLNTVPPDTGIAKVLSSLWRRHSINVWRSKSPVRVKNLSGGLVLLKEAAVRLAGGLFDPRFFLYFEDTDLFIRIRRTGYRLVIDPRAQAIHYYNQCSVEEVEKKRAYMSDSFSVFLEKQGNTWIPYVLKIIERLGSFNQWHRGIRSYLHEFSAPFTLKVPPSLRRGWLFEWSPNPNFIPSAGRFGSGSIMSFHEGFWKKLVPGRYFGRLGRDKTIGSPFLEFSWVVGAKQNARLSLTPENRPG